MRKRKGRRCEEQSINATIDDLTLKRRVQPDDKRNACAGNVEKKSSKAELSNSNK